MPVTERQVDRVIELYAERARNSIRPEGIQLLDRSAGARRSTRSRTSSWAFWPAISDSHLVLCYQNGEGWFEVHPLVRDHVRRRAAEMAEAKPSP